MSAEGIALAEFGIALGILGGDPGGRRTKPAAQFATAFYI
jgi:hypothetical protein